MTVNVVAAMKPVQSRATPGVFKTKKDSATVKYLGVATVCYQLRPQVFVPDAAEDAPSAQAVKPGCFLDLLGDIEEELS